MKYRRHLEGRTNYKLRLGLLKFKKPRLVVRKSLKHIVAQIVEYKPDGDKVITTAKTTELKKNYGWNRSARNIPSGYLLGLLIASKSLKKGVNEVVLDTGLHPKTKGSVLFAVLRGAVEYGLKIPHSKDIFPADSRIKGDHIKNDKIKNKYTKSNPDKITQDFESVKQKLLVGKK